MTGLGRLYISASALALAGMAWRVGWFGSHVVDRICTVLLFMIGVLIAVLCIAAVVILAVAIVMLPLWLLYKLVMIGAAPLPSSSGFPE